MLKEIVVMTAGDFENQRLINPNLILLDVRTEEELAIARVDPCVHVPLHELERRVAELRPYALRTVVCMCHHGVRSAMAAGFLREQGFTDVHNLSGGIHAYALEVNPGIPTYG